MREHNKIVDEGGGYGSLMEIEGKVCLWQKNKRKNQTSSLLTQAHERKR